MFASPIILYALSRLIFLFSFADVERLSVLNPCFFHSQSCIFVLVRYVFWHCRPGCASLLLKLCVWALQFVDIVLPMLVIYYFSYMIVFEVESELSLLLSLQMSSAICVQQPSPTQRTMTEAHGGMCLRTADKHGRPLWLSFRGDYNCVGWTKHMAFFKNKLWFQLDFKVWNSYFVFSTRSDSSSTTTINLFHVKIHQTLQRSLWKELELYHAWTPRWKSHIGLFWFQEVPALF